MNTRNLDINLTEVKFKNNHVVYENFIKCTIKDYEFNLSYNPTLLSGSQATLYPYTYKSGSGSGAITGSETFYEITGSKYFGILKDFATGSILSSDGTSSFSPYVSTIGLYNDAQELLAVAKMAVPTPLSANTDMTFLVKFDTQWIEKPYFTPTPSPSRTPAASTTPTPTVSKTPSVTPTVTPSVTPSVSIGSSPSITPTISLTPSITPTISVTPTITVTPSISVTPSLTPSPTPACGAFGTFTKDSGTGTFASADVMQQIFSSTVAGTTIITGSLTTTCPNQIVRLYAFSGTGGSYSQGSTDIVNVLGTGFGNYSRITTNVGPGGGLTDSAAEVIITLPGTYNVVLRGFFNNGSNPPTTSNRVWLFIDLP
jgi:hypothetical protein